jgi:MoCo/4Fe-4S cofactor protein with predicted Tat translocation signal
MDLAAIRSRLAAADGPTYWRSLEELADTPEFQELISTASSRRTPRRSPIRSAAGDSSS